jgi:hypothetical protein
MKTCDKLPQIITLDEYEGDWEQFLNAIYSVFKTDLIDNKTFFATKEVGINYEKLYQEKERSFWHIISEGKNDIDRLPDLRRCERIAWVKPFIELVFCAGCTNIRMWKKLHAKSKKDRYYIWCTDVDFIVILEDRKNYFLLITAFVVKYPDTRESYHKDYDNYLKYKTKAPIKQ